MKLGNPAGHPCDCGDPNAPFGIGPPLREVLVWLCHTCWQREPSTQKLFGERLAAAMEGGEDEAA